jgi:outer membrane protein W
MKKLMVVAVVVIALLAIAPANAQGNKFKVYAAFNYVAPTGSSDLDFEGSLESVEATQEAGWSLGFEWRIGKWAGIEFDYLKSSHDVESDGEQIAETSMSPLSASFNFHLIHTKILDFYFGPTVSYVSWDDIDTIEGETIPTDSEWAYGAQIGLDFSIIKSVAIVTGLRYTQLDVTGDEDSVAVNPLYAKIGVAIRF